MFIWKFSILLYCFFIFFPQATFADYIEGIDTTDANGYGLDSSFQVHSDYKYIGAPSAFGYYVFLGGEGYYNYSFDDIQIAPSNFRHPRLMEGSGLNLIHNCFVIKNKKDSTYSKCQVLQNITGNRYLFRYGTNTTPNDRMFVKFNYDRSIRYKPNNLFNIFRDYPRIDTTSWEAPLPSNNHLLGYIFYRTKSNAIIDTSAPIDSAQWESVGVIDSMHSTLCLTPYDLFQNRYINLVAVYTEGKSEFLKGWSLFYGGIVSTKQTSSSSNWSGKSKLKIKMVTGGFFISLEPFRVATSYPSLSIYTMAGQRVAQFCSIMTNRIFWNTSQRNLAEGLYLVRAELPDGSVINKPLMYERW